MQFIRPSSTIYTQNHRNEHRTEEGTSQQDSAVPSQYNFWAPIYDAFWSRYLDGTLPVLLQATNVTAGERVLDVACGTGELERRALETSPETQWVGIDIADAMIAQARRKFDDTQPVQFDQEDAHDLPYENNSFDVVVSASSFHYFTSPTIVLDEIARVLRPSGRLVVLDWCRDFTTCQILDVMLRWMDPAYRTCYTLREMREYLEGADLKVRDSFRYRFGMVWGMMVIQADPANGT